MYVEKIKSPADIKQMSVEQLKILATEIRNGILNRDSIIGGHVGPNLGVVELTIALHYVFSSPKDKIVFDVSHQCYPHKMLTGRAAGFWETDQMSQISGYTNPDESEHDFFKVGHTSTSVSLACGLAKARDLQGEKHNVIAVIGDGSLSGGEALEGLSNAAAYEGNIIVIVNDNEMSIAENHGGIYTNLRKLRESNGTDTCNMFKALGFDYKYVADGNSPEDLIAALQKVKDSDFPVLLHVHTTKGKGYKPAEENKERWHWNMPFDIKSGENTVDFSGENINDVTMNFLQNKIAEDKKVAIVVAGTPGAFGLNPERRKALGQNYIDVGIAEEHAVAMSSALAKGGCKPVFCVWSSFIQRTYDQLSQDLAINNNAAVILVFSGAISAMDVTHLGCFDVPLIANIPNITYLAPSNKDEYLAMLDWGIEQNKGPVVIRVPLTCESANRKVMTGFDQPNKFEKVRNGKDVAVIAAGSFFGLGEKVADELAKKGVNATLINPRYLTGIDEDMLNSLKGNHRVVVTLENGLIDGGFGEKTARFYGTDEMKVLVRGAQKEFTDRTPLDELYRRYRLEPEMIVADILAQL